MNPAVTVRPAVCPLDCADTCSLSIEVENDKVTRVRGSNVNPFTRGKICAKVANGLAEQVHGPKRLTQPMLRDGPKGAGAYRPVSWEQALDVVYENFQRVIAQYGAEAIAPLQYGGPMGLLAGRSMDKRFFHRLGASAVDSTTLCAGVSGAAWDSVYGDVGGIAFTELAQSRLIVVWGNNVTACNLHLTTIIRRARKTGAKLVVVDPKRIRIADDADLFLPLMPGTDVVLAYAVAAELQRTGGLDVAFMEQHVQGAEAFLAEAGRYSLDEAASICGLSADDIRQFAVLWKECAPAAISLGVAPERNRNGGSGVRAILALPALTGNFGQPGAGVCDVSGFFPVQSEELGRPDLLSAPVREFNTLDIPRHIQDPGDETPIKAVFVYNHNPVAVHPQASQMQAALLSEEVFAVGSDVSMTDSMACCDVILPAASHLEYGDLYKAYGHHYLQRSEPAIEPQGEALPNTEIFRRLAARFGFDEACFGDSDEMLMDQALPEGEAALDGVRPSELSTGQAIDMSDAPSLLRGLPPATPSGKIELYSESLAQQRGLGVPRFRELQRSGRYVLVSPASEHRINSTLGGVGGHDRDLLCEMHPEDAAVEGFNDGERIRLFNAQGNVELALSITDKVRPGTLYVPKGAWLESCATGQTVNALIPGHQEEQADGACYYDCTVDAEPA